MGKPKSRVKKPYIAAIFVAFFVLFAVKNAAATTNISDCGTLDTPGEMYLLTADITNNTGYDNDGGPCLYINASDINLDCQGHILDGIDNSNDGIETPFSDNDFNNITVFNCTTINFFEGIYLSYSDESNILFSNMSFNTYGFESDYATTGFLINNTAKNNSQTAFSIYESSNFSIENNSLIDNNKGIGFQSNCINSIIKNNLIINNIVSSLVIQAASNENLFYDNYIDTPDTNPEDSLFSGINNWNTTVGNFWTNSTANGWSDTCTCVANEASPYGGICAEPYIIDENNTDYLPLCIAEQECVPSWNCTAWGECVRGYQSRVCTDDNSCQNETGKPAETQLCLKALPNATFNITDSCCPISTFYCTDNETLVQLWNTSEGVSWAVEACANGCDNVTNDCAPAPYQTGILNILIVIIVIVAIGLVYRYSRR